MKFKDRGHAGTELAKVLKTNKGYSKKNLVIISLLRGGVVLGNVLAAKFKTSHLGLVVTKIPAPFNPELAIGALCFDVTYLEKSVVESLKLTNKEIASQIVVAEQKFAQYALRFDLKEDGFVILKGKDVLLVDDGIATGATAKAGALFAKSKGAKTVNLAVPVAPTDLKLEGFDNVYILYKDPHFRAVSQYYDFFPQIEDNEVKKLLNG